MRACDAHAYLPPLAPARASFWPVARGLRPWAGTAKVCLLELGPYDGAEFPPCREGATLREVNGLSCGLLGVG